MSCNNLYDTLMEMAKIENIQFSETQSARQSQSQVLTEFAQKMKQIRSQIEQTRRNNGRILKMKDKMAANAVPSKQAQLFDETRQLCDENYELIVKVRKDLEQLTDIVQKAKKEHPDQPETHAQIYQKQYMINEVNGMISDTQKVQLLIQRYSINTSLKRIKALAPQLSEEQAEKIARKRDGYDQLIMQKTLGKASLKLKYRVEDIADKNEQIFKLERSVEQNLKLMEQIAYLVKQQGEMIDNIHDNILNAKDYIEKAEVVLKDEKKEHKKSRKKLCCIILIGVVILAIIIVPIILTIVNNNKNKTPKTTS